MQEQPRIAAAREFTRALVKDIQESPDLSRTMDRLITEFPASEAGTFITAIRGDLVRELQQDYQDPLFPRTRMVLRKAIREEAAARDSGGMGFIGTLLAVALPALTGAAATIYTAKLQIKAQKDIAELQGAQRMREAEAAKAEAEARRAEAEAAIKKAGEEAIVKEEAAGLPGWVLPVGAAVVIGGIILFTRK